MTTFFYESGGGARNSGRCQVVCGQNGEALRPDWQPDRLYAQDRHAGFTPRPTVGLVVVEADWSHGETIATTRHVQDDGTLGEPVYTLDNNGQETGAAICFRNAARAAIEKAHCYHCRCRHFVEK